MATAPALGRPASTPSGPSHTEREARSSATIETMNSASSAAAAGLAAGAAPAPTRVPRQLDLGALEGVPQGHHRLGVALHHQVTAEEQGVAIGAPLDQVDERQQGSADHRGRRHRGRLGDGLEPGPRGIGVKEEGERQVGGIDQEGGRSQTAEALEEVGMAAPHGPQRRLERRPERRQRQRRQGEAQQQHR